MFSIQSNLLAQSDSISQQQKGSFYATATPLIVYNTLGISYEHNLWKANNLKHNNRFRLTAGAKVYTFMGFEMEEFVSLQYQYIYGIKNQLDMGVGIQYYNTWENRWVTEMSFNLGGRKLNKDGKHIFNYGVGYPELIYAGYGVVF